ncbi:protein of unknown function [Actinacidiphila alni]|uniref:DUF4132 domain-containing protein n=1 Tax=Actinacidiphila alni TaxID=380248 RepID=A0A1I1WSP1_9ACTN|nr:DUF4132 domain-containing protein [Actinacidiphila alni]SFD98059.1 protein of unknown function [Actinacidiphila alni]
MTLSVTAWWAARRGYDFPRRVTGRTAAPLQPRSLSRALVRAARADERARAGESGRRGAKSAGDVPWTTAAPGPHSAAAVAALSQEDRRRAALAVQRLRSGLVVRDREQRISAALAAAHCRWSARRAEELFALALEGIDPVRPAVTWRPDTPRALELPLAAYKELATADRERLHPYLRTVLTIHHFDAPLGTSDPSPDPAADPARHAFVARLRALLPPAYDVDGLLGHRDAFSTAARKALGAHAYRPEVAELICLCARLTDPRPSYEWLGRVRELVQSRPDARIALAPLLRSAGAHLERPGAVRHSSGELTAESGLLLSGAAWAVCVTERVAAVRDLERALSQYVGVPPEDLSEGAAVFVRGGFAALGALAGEPGVGQHQRLLTASGAKPVKAAQEALLHLRRYPTGWDQDALSVPIGEYTAHFTVAADGRVTLGFRNQQGRLLAKAPRRVRSRTPAAYAALRARLAELNERTTALLGSFSERLHGDPGQSAQEWRTAHLDPPVFEPLTRALIWQADTLAGPVVGVPVRRKRSTGWMLRDLQGRFHELIDTTTIRLWDPRQADAAEVAAWAAALRRRRTVQPVPQLARLAQRSKSPGT